MKYTIVNGKKLSNMSLGTVQLGLNYGIANDLGKPDITKSTAMLNCALDHGISSLDTARAYGTAENVLGDYFKANPRADMPFITSKVKSIKMCGNPTSDAEVEKLMYTSVETSLKTLGVTKLDCLLLHDSTDMTGFGDIVPRTLDRLVREGYADIAGVSVYTADEVETMLRYDAYQAIQVPMSLFDQTLIHQGYIDRLKEKNALVFVRSVFLQGLFFMDPATLTDPLLIQYARPYIEKLRTFCDRAGMSIAEFAISFIRDIPGVTSLVLGADTEAQVLQNIEYMNAPGLSEDLREEVEEAFRDVDIENIMVVLRRPKPQQ